MGKIYFQVLNSLHPSANHQFHTLRLPPPISVSIIFFLSFSRSENTLASHKALPVTPLVIMSDSRSFGSCT